MTQDPHAGSRDPITVSLPESTMDPSRTDGRKRAFAVIAFALAALALRCISRTSDVLPIAAPFQADYEEGNILNALTRILQGAIRGLTRSFSRAS